MDISTVQLSWYEMKAFIDTLELMPLLKASGSEFKEILGLVGG